MTVIIQEFSRRLWFLFVLGCGSPVWAGGFLVEEGQARAEIVISAAPDRMQRLAAHEFRSQVEKITGARLPIVTEPAGTARKVFIGASPHNPVTAEGLTHGAFRIVSGPDWLALIGDDRDFLPTEPWAKSNSDIPRAQAEWEKIMGAPYGMPNAGLYKNRLRLPGDTGKPDGAVTEPKELLEIWGFDERGSFNAVCGFLHRLGARWYLPGELGEVLPTLKSIALPEIDETVRPDFELRQFNFRNGVVGSDTAMWTMRLGMRNDDRWLIAHGLDGMTGRDAVFAQHPEWFALYGGKRDYTPGQSKNQLCYSNEELFQEAVSYARTLLDTYPVHSVSIMPPDGYTAICQCDKCQGKDSPERNERGRFSDHVWDFVNRVAREVAKTHPNAKVLNCAYGVYTLPPLGIEKLEPNVVVCIVGGRRPINRGGSKAEGEAAPEALREAWRKKTAQPLMIFENYPFTDRGWYLPSFAAHALGDSVNATKGISQGEDIWLSVRQDFDKVGIGFNHFLVYFTARMYWGGTQADADAMLAEYCRLFYGPAEREMRAFLDFCEANWAAMDQDKNKADEALGLFAAAQAKAPADSVYGKRLALIDDFLKGLRMKTVQLAQARGPLPVVRLVGEAAGIVIDGKLDDAYWQTCPAAATGRLRELQTAQVPTFGTSFRTGWHGKNLYFAIRCEDHPGEKPNDTATRSGDQAIFYGDVVEIQLATETNSYYQIAISPGGAVVDLDRGAGRDRWFDWDSQAEVATEIGEGYWTVEIRIPVTEDENDPLHQVIGRKPIVSLPWHINVCRQRIREDGKEWSAFSPTGVEGFHEPLKFAYFYHGQSHVFLEDPSVTDFALGFQKAGRTRQAAAFLALAGDKSANAFQKSLALEKAAQLDWAQASEIVARIPIDAVRATAEMQVLLNQGKAADVVARFGGEDLGKWPFWKRGDGYYARGRAYLVSKDGPRAEADLKAALEWTREPRTRDAIGLALGNNRETTLKDDDAALQAYESVVADRTRIGGADEFASLQGQARVLTRQGKFDEALAALDRADPAKLTGVWRGNIFLSIGDVLSAAGRKEGAASAYRTVAEDAAMEARLRKTAQERLDG